LGNWGVPAQRTGAVGLTRFNLFAKKQQKGFTLASLTRAFVKFEE
jgi:hypothetical protein